jgi:transposase-like protein
MPWNESTRMDERLAFVEAYLTRLYTMSELCRSAGVSRPTGYLWVGLPADGRSAACSIAPMRCGTARTGRLPP